MADLEVVLQAVPVAVLPGVLLAVGLEVHLVEARKEDPSSRAASPPAASAPAASSLAASFQVGVHPVASFPAAAHRVASFREAVHPAASSLEVVHPAAFLQEVPAALMEVDLSEDRLAARLRGLLVELLVAPWADLRVVPWVDWLVGVRADPWAAPREVLRGALWSDRSSVSSEPEALAQVR